MYPATYAAQAPDRIAAVMAGTGETVSYGDLERRSAQLAHVLHDGGLRPGDVVALLTENSLRALEVLWAALRSGLYITAVNYRLKPDEVAYIVNDSGAAALIVSAEQAATATALRVPAVKLRLAFGGAVPGYGGYEATIAAASDTPLDDQPHGSTMLYSSGTTGRPKGVRPPLPGVQVGEPAEGLVELARLAFGFNEDTIYLSPGPIYHAAPLRFCGAVQALGGTVVMMKRFDAEQALQAISDHRATHAQFVPTMFVRMLQLPREVRDRYDVSSLRVAIHAAAPCPIPVKEKMIDWWGPIVWEYYGGTEGNGLTLCNATEWMAHKGTVGRAVVGTLRICDEDGNELPAGESGTVYFADGRPFEYHNDPKKTAESRHARGWTTLGDVGYVDGDGFLHLTDRKAFMIISGGVNIYPQECENLLINHPRVMDCAVFGVPNADFGEEVKAVVQPRDMAEAGPALADELLAYCRQHLSALKCPRSIDFEAELPRHPTGKLYKRLLRDRYWQGRESRIV